MMEPNLNVSYTETVPVQNEHHIRQLKYLLTNVMAYVKMGSLNQTKLMTAASELMRNMLQYGGGGQVTLEVVSHSKGEKGLQLIFADNGPGIPDINIVMQDGYSTGNTLGIGLPGTKRLVDDFLIKSEVGKGTTVSITKWVNG